MSDFKAKTHQIRFPLWLRPRPRWRSLQRSPDQLAVFKGPTSKGMEGERKERKGRGREGRVGPHLGSLDPPVWNIGHRPVVCIQLCLVLLSPPSSPAVLQFWCPHFLSGVQTLERSSMSFSGPPSTYSKCTQEQSW